VTSLKGRHAERENEKEEKKKVTLKAKTQCEQES